MSDEYKRIATSAEVWAVIKAKHGSQLSVFSSFSDPNGDAFGGGGTTGTMETSYGFKIGDYPIMEARSTWSISSEKPHERLDEIHEYWLCLPIKAEN